MKHLIRKILKESYNNKFVAYITNKLDSGEIKAPYFKNLKEKYGLTNKEINFILSKFFGGNISLRKKEIYDENGNSIYTEPSDGYWSKREYDKNGNMIYYETSDSNWEKWEYDERGNILYRIDSFGNWTKSEYDKKDNMIYHETSFRGVIMDKR